MNYDQARQRKSNGRWDFTRMNDGRVWPIGYCRDHEDGHATAEEAERHYYEYELDTARFDTEYAGVQHPCAICGAWTSKAASYGPGMMTSVDLCDEHRNREGLERAHPFRPGMAHMGSA